MLYCGQTPRQGRMAAMLVRTSWPRTEAEPAVGGKRPLRMDLQEQGSQGSFRGEAEAPSTYRAPTVCPDQRGIMFPFFFFKKKKIFLIGG